MSVLSAPTKKIALGSRFLKNLLALLRLGQAPRRLVIVAGACIAGASIAQLTGLGLVVPVLNGLVDEHHFEGIKHTPILGDLLTSLPFEQTNRNIFLVMMVLILFSVYAENVLVYFGRHFSLRVNTSVVCNLRVLLFQTFMEYAKPFHDNQKPANLNTLLVTVTLAVGQVAQNAAQMCILSMFALTFFSLMVVISWQLTLCAAILLPIAHAVAKTITRRIERAARSELDSLMTLSNRSLDVLRNVTLTQLSGAESQELEDLRRSAEGVRDHGLKSNSRRFLVPCVVDIINSTGVVAVVAMSVFLFFKMESYSLGRLLVYLVSLRRFTSHIEQLSGTWAQAIANAPSLEQLLDVLAPEDKPVIKSGAKPFRRVEREVQFKDVSFHYQTGQSVLGNINFSLPAGKIAAIVGPTGSGKSTLVHLIPRFYEPSSGEILIDGTSINNFELSSLRKKIAIVSQNTLIFHDTLRNNITYGLRAGEYSEGTLLHALESAQLTEFLKDLPHGLETIVGTGGERLSGGELQRVSIARALLRDPEILILDEPTSALDATTEQKLQLALSEIVTNRTVFVVAHRLATVKSADLIIVLKKGRIIEQGSPADLLKQEGEFFKFWELQNL